MFLVLTSSPLYEAADIAERQSSADKSFWPSFLTPAASPQLQSFGTAQSFAAAAPPAGGYFLNTPLGGRPSRPYPGNHKEQQEAMAQTLLFSAYPAPYTYLQRPSQQQQGNYISYPQLVPSFQGLNLGGIPFGSSYQPRYTTLPSNLTQGLNVSASHAIPTTGLFPAVHNSYFPSALGASPSWQALALSALQSSKNNVVGGFSATPLYQSAANTGSLNSLAPLTLDSFYKTQKGLNTDYLTFPPTAYNQDFGQLVLSTPKQNPHAQVRANKQRVNKALSAGEHKTTAHEPSTKGRYQYSSEYSKPVPDSEDKGSYTRNGPQDLDDSYDSEQGSKSSDSYKNSDSSRHSNDEDEDKNFGDYRNSNDFAENTKRPQYTPSSSDDDDDDSEKSSDFPPRSSSFSKSTPSKEASRHSDTFSDAHHEFGPKNFEDQFKAFPTNENFKVPDFTAESSKTVTDYYKNPVSSSEKHVKMAYRQRSKVTDKYMIPSEQKLSETPKTLHYYNYKAPEYSYDRPVEYFPSSSVKSLPKESTTHRTTSPPYDDKDQRDDREDRDSGEHDSGEHDSGEHDSSTVTATRANKMYK